MLQMETFKVTFDSGWNYGVDRLGMVHVVDMCSPSDWTNWHMREEFTKYRFGIS